MLLGVVFVGLMSLLRNDGLRLRVNAAVAVGASGTYIATGTFGPLELVLSTIVLVVAFQGFRSWRWVGVAWLLHTALDIAHAVRGVDLLPWAPNSAVGCAICDPVIALWCFGGGRPVDHLLRQLAGRLRGAPGDRSRRGEHGPLGSDR